MVLFHPVTDGPLRYVHQFEKTIGGAESNVAVGLARLGHQVSWISRLGDDEFGLYIRNFLRGEGVDTSHVRFDPVNPTAVFFKERQPARETKVYYYRRGSAASFLTPADLDEQVLAQARFLHLTGITPALSDSCRQTVEKAIELAKRHGVTVVFDPNVRLKLWSADEARAILTEIARQCDIVLPGLEEGELLTGESTPEGIAKKLLQGDTKAVVIKLGAQGAYYATSEEEAYIPGYPVAQVVDPIGAGDGFAAGFLSGMIRGWSYHQAISLGNRVGAYAVTVKGDVEGYPYWAEVAPERDQKEIFR